MPLLRAARTVRPGMTDVIPGGASERRIITVLFCDVVSSTAPLARRPRTASNASTSVLMVESIEREDITHWLQRQLADVNALPG